MNIVNIEDGYCKRIRSYLDSYLNNELLVETNHEVLKHLETCAACARSLEDRTRLKDQLKRAVMQEYAPVALRERISGTVRSRRGFRFNTLTLALTAAAAVIVIALTVPFVFKSNPAKEALSLHAEVTRGDVTGQLLKIGFDDHVYCAIDHKMATQQFTVEQMSERLGPDYAGLVELVKNRLPDYNVAIGHRCHYQDREFIHLILRHEQEVVSLIITRKNGESFSDVQQSLQAAGIRIYERPLQNLQVAGLETRDYLAFIVSNKTKDDTLQLATRIAQPVRDFLKNLES